jgi:hypothetical protein
MADVKMWTDKQTRAAFEKKAQAVLAELMPKLEGQTGVIALEPESGEYFIGPTLGKADAAAYVKFPDKWLWFARLDNPAAALALATW